MADEKEIQAAKKTVKETLASAVENPSELRIKNAANALVMANSLIKAGDSELRDIRSEATKGQTTKFQNEFDNKLTQEIKNIQKWHEKAQQAKVAPSKPTISKTAKAVASQIGNAMNAALKAPGRIGAAVVQRVTGKDKGPSR